MTDEGRLRDLLLDNSDHRAVRRVWEVYTGTGEADVCDYVETMKATGGALALVYEDGEADVYVRFAHGGYERLTVWPPWSLGGVEAVDRESLTTLLGEKESVRPVHIEETPFVDDEFDDVTGRVWP